MILQKTCFAAGTPILTPNGEKPIESLVKGDQILSRPEDDPSAPVRVSFVERVFELSATIVELRVGGQVLETTAEHPFYVVERGWVQTIDLQPGDLLLGRDERTACVQSVTATTRTATVYNLRVAADHTFFVGSHAWGFSLWVHNTYKIQPSKIDGKWDVVDPFGNPVLKNLDEAQADEIAKGLNDWKAGKGGDAGSKEYRGGKHEDIKTKKWVAPYCLIASG